MNIIKKHIHHLLEKDIRLDGRKPDEFRKDIVIEYGTSAKSAEGSARVKIGETEVVAGIKMEVGQPYPDTPDQGSIIAGVELRPLSSPEFEAGPPNIQSIELSRAVIDRGIRESHSIDFEKLCIKKGEKSWTILIDVYSINDAGNLADASGLAALAALKDARFPTYDAKEEKIKYDLRTDKKIELEHLPIPITVIKIKDKYIIDPTVEEEAVMDARLTVTTTEEGNICAMQKGGFVPLSTQDIEAMAALSLKKGKELRKLLEKA